MTSIYTTFANNNTDIISRRRIERHAAGDGMAWGSESMTPREAADDMGAIVLCEYHDGMALAEPSDRPTWWPTWVARGRSRWRRKRTCSTADRHPPPPTRGLTRPACSARGAFWVGATYGSGDTTMTNTTNINLTAAALANLEELGLDDDDIRADVDALRTGKRTRDAFLAECLDGADEDREEGGVTTCPPSPPQPGSHDRHQAHLRRRPDHAGAGPRDPAERDAYDAAAEAAGVSRSEWLRALAAEALSAGEATDPAAPPTRT